MLYIIKNGYNGVKKRNQADIVYLIAPLGSVLENEELQWCFTDGHARNLASRFFNQREDFDKVDWETVKDSDWKNTEQDFDRKRRKQAEFLVKNYLPAACISHIIVYNEEMRIFVQAQVDRIGLTAQVSKSLKHYY